EAEVSKPRIRRASASELDEVIAIFADGFAEDPVWGVWTFPAVLDRARLLREFWAPYVLAADKYEGVIVTDDLSAVSLWVPPGTQEMDEQDEAAAAEMLLRVCGERASLLDLAWEAFGRSRPEPAHWYLSLLATAPSHRGRGAGMGLVQAHLEQVDDDGLPAYLESTNPANIGRYQRVGFELDGYFDLPQGPRVDRMWRDAQ
ncbi:MAG: GNAT family N-acetyltransferase, partial [Actinomycetes bacterium]